MLDDLWPGERAGLGDMADEDDGDAGCLGEVDQFHAAGAELSDRAGGGGEIGLVDHLDGIDDDDRRVDFADLVDYALEIGLGENEQIGRGNAEAGGAEFGLAGGFFAGDVENFGSAEG